MTSYPQRSRRPFVLTTRRLLAALPVAALTTLPLAPEAAAVAKSWNSASNGNWNVANNWTPPGVPLAGDDVTLGNIVGTFGTRTTMDVNDTMNSLTLLNGNDLDTSSFSTFVATATSISGSGSTLLVKPRSTQSLISFDTNTLDLNAGATVQMLGGRLQVDSGVFDVGGNLTGFGNIQLDQSVGANTTLLNMSGSGYMRVGYTFDGIGILTDQARTLQITAADTDARVDFDNGVPNTVELLPSGTLDLDVMMADTFNDTMIFNRKSTYDSALAWDFAGTLDVNTQAGFFVGQTAGPATVAGQLMTMSGGTINLDNTADHLIFANTGFTATGGQINLTTGKIQFDASTTIGAGADFQIGNSNTEIIVNSAVNIDDADFNWDGGGGATNITTINSGVLDLDLTSFDGNDSYDGGINLNGGELDVTVTDGEWIFGGGDTFEVNGAGTKFLNGSRARFEGTLNANAGTLDVNAASHFVGGSQINVDPGATVRLDGVYTLFNGATHTINGTLDLSANGGIVLAPNLNGTGLIRFSADTLIDSTLNDTVINVNSTDLDGTGETGTVITIESGAALIVNSNTINDTVNGHILVQDSLFTVAPNWTLGSSGLIQLDATGASAEVPTLGSGGTLTVASGGLVQVVGSHADIATPTVLQEGSTLSIASINGQADVNALLTLDGGDVTGAAGADLLPVAITVTGASAINVSNYNMDGGTLTLAPGGNLDVNVTSIESAGVEQFDGSMNFTGGTINVNNAANTWIMDGTINSNGGGNLFGDRVEIGDDTGSLDANINVNTGNLNIGAPATFFSDADVNVAAGATLTINNANTIFQPFGGIGVAGEFTGAGTLRVVGATFNEITTFNMTGGTVGLDGSLSGNGGLVLLTAGDNVFNAQLTINAAAVDDYGFTSVFPASTSELIINNSGSLIVNLDNPNGSWTVLSNGIVNYNGDAIAGTIIGGSADVNFNGTLNVNGEGSMVARVDFGATADVNINNAADDLRLVGGTIGDPNTIAGGDISGPGNLVALAGRALSGFGTLGSNADFDGDAELIANGGVLDVNASILDVGTLRANSGTLQLDVNFASSTTQNGISLDNGTLQGAGLITLDVRNLRGNGTVTSRINNNNIITAQGGTLTVNNALNDWDGSGNAGVLRAQTGDLTLVDNAAFIFNGTVQADSGRTVFANGFELEFDPASSLILNGGTYRSTNATDIGGTVTVGAGNSNLNIAGTTVFESTSNSTLTGNLRLNNNTTINPGATFSGGGSLTVAGGTTVLATGSSVGVLVINDSALNIGPGNTVGTATVQDLDQENGAVLAFDINGTALNQFDRLSVTGTAALDGILDADFFFGAGLGDTFPVLTALNVNGTFDSLDITGLGAGLDVLVNYNPTSVVLEIINAVSIVGDYNGSGQVEQGDLDLVLGNWGSPTPPIPAGWVNDFPTGIVDQAELDKVLANWGNTSAPDFNPAAVPEPGTAALLTLAGAGLMRRRRSA